MPQFQQNELKIEIDTNYRSSIIRLMPNLNDHKLLQRTYIEN